MSKTPKDKDQEKGDEVLRRLLKTPPKPKPKPPARKPETDPKRKIDQPKD